MFELSFKNKYIKVHLYVEKSASCSPRDPMFAGSNPTEVSPPGGGPESEISGSLKNLKPAKIVL